MSELFLSYDDGKERGKDVKNRTPNEYLLRVVTPTGALIREEFELDGSRVVLLCPMGTEIVAYERKVGAAGIVRYRTAHGWLSEFRRDMSRDPIVELLDLPTRSGTMHSTAHRDIDSSQPAPIAVLTLRESACLALNRAHGTLSALASSLSRSIVADSQFLGPGRRHLSASVQSQCLSEISHLLATSLSKIVKGFYTHAKESMSDTCRSQQAREKEWEERKNVAYSSPELVGGRKKAESTPTSGSGGSSKKSGKIDKSQQSSPQQSANLRRRFRDDDDDEDEFKDPRGGETFSVDRMTYCLFQYEALRNITLPVLEDKNGGLNTYILRAMLDAGVIDELFSSFDEVVRTLRLAIDQALVDSRAEGSEPVLSALGRCSLQALPCLMSLFRRLVNKEMLMKQPITKLLEDSYEMITPGAPFQTYDLIYDTLTVAGNSLLPLFQSHSLQNFPPDLQRDWISLVSDVIQALATRLPDPLGAFTAASDSAGLGGAEYDSSGIYARERLSSLRGFRANAESSPVSPNPTPTPYVARPSGADEVVIQSLEEMGFERSAVLRALAAIEREENTDTANNIDRVMDYLVRNPNLEDAQVSGDASTLRDFQNQEPIPDPNLPPTPPATLSGSSDDGTATISSRNPLSWNTVSSAPRQQSESLQPPQPPQLPFRDPITFERIVAAGPPHPSMPSLSDPRGLRSHLARIEGGSSHRLPRRVHRTPESAALSSSEFVGPPPPGARYPPSKNHIVDCEKKSSVLSDLARVFGEASVGNVFAWCAYSLESSKWSDRPLRKIAPLVCAFVSRVSQILQIQELYPVPLMLKLMQRLDEVAAAQDEMPAASGMLQLLLSLLRHHPARISIQTDLSKSLADRLTRLLLSFLDTECRVVVNNQVTTNRRWLPGWIAPAALVLHDFCLSSAYPNHFLPKGGARGQTGEGRHEISDEKYDGAKEEYESEDHKAFYVGYDSPANDDDNKRFAKQMALAEIQNHMCVLRLLSHELWVQIFDKVLELLRLSSTGLRLIGPVTSHALLQLLTTLVSKDHIARIFARSDGISYVLSLPPSAAFDDAGTLLTALARRCMETPALLRIGMTNDLRLIFKDLGKGDAAVQLSAFLKSTLAMAVRNPTVFSSIVFSKLSFSASSSEELQNGAMHVRWVGSLEEDDDSINRADFCLRNLKDARIWSILSHLTSFIMSHEPKKCMWNTADVLNVLSDCSLLQKGMPQLVAAFPIGELKSKNIVEFVVENYCPVESSLTALSDYSALRSAVRLLVVLSAHRGSPRALVLGSLIQCLRAYVTTFVGKDAESAEVNDALSSGALSNERQRIRVLTRLGQLLSLVVISCKYSPSHAADHQSSNRHRVSLDSMHQLLNAGLPELLLIACNSIQLQDQAATAAVNALLEPLDMLTRPKLIQHLQRWLKRTATLRSSDVMNGGSREASVDAGVGPVEVSLIQGIAASRAGHEEADDIALRVGAVYTNDSADDIVRGEMQLQVDVNYAAAEDTVSSLLSSPDDDRPSFSEMMEMRLEEEEDEVLSRTNLTSSYVCCLSDANYVSIFPVCHSV